MIPKAFLFTPVASLKSSYTHGDGKRCRRDAFGDVSDYYDFPTEAPSTTHTSPVVIPTKYGSSVRSSRQPSTGSGPKPPKRSQTLRRASSNVSSKSRPLPSSVASILEATAIPAPRRNRSTRTTRKLPRKIHLEDFSKMLMDDVEEDRLLAGTGNSALDLLLSPPEEAERMSITGSDSDMASLSGRSLSTESTPSLDHDLDSPSSSPGSFSPFSPRSPSEKKYRRVSLSEDCAFNHPLLDTLLSDAEVDDMGQTKAALTGSVSPQTPSPSRSFARFGSFKSNLTASLRAIKSAAQTVSAFTTPSVQPDDFLTRSLFTITPELTDDRRPPPMDEPPSPALRRYLNPIIVSPAEMHIYHDEHPHGAAEASRKSPVSIQMQTYRRSGGRSNRKRAFHLAGAGGRGNRPCCPFDPEISPMSRQREPRENSDFLRVVVLEMNMRRSGKLRNDIPPRARVWLPPRKNSQPRCPYNDYFYDDFEEEDEDENGIPSRWIGITV